MLLTLNYHIEIHPNAFATELIRIIAAKIGQMYLIITQKIFFLRNVPSPCKTSASTAMTAQDRTRGSPSPTRCRALRDASRATARQASGMQESVFPSPHPSSSTTDPAQRSGIPEMPPPQSRPRSAYSRSHDLMLLSESTNVIGNSKAKNPLPSETERQTFKAAVRQKSNYSCCREDCS